MDQNSDDQTTQEPQDGTQSEAPAQPAPAEGPAIVPAPEAPVRIDAVATDLDEARRFGRVDDEGHVFVVVGESEYAVGQYPGTDKDEALAYFVKKYDDVVNQVALLEARIASGNVPGNLTKTLQQISLSIADHRFVGDLEALAARIEALRENAAEAQAKAKERAAARAAESLTAREAVVAEAEEISAQDPRRIQWKQSSARMAELFEEWQRLQKAGPRQSKSVEEGLWKRFRGARAAFEKNRRSHFSQLDAEHAEAKAAKEKLIQKAEELSSSTDWGVTAGKYRDLMTEWKSAKRASRKDDDALWARFRAAQDVFFNARQAANDEIDASYRDNLTVKEGLLKRAEALLPVKDLAAAKREFAIIRDEWESAGKVPRKDMGRMDGGLRRVEDAIRAAEREEWDRTNPEVQARANSALSQLDESLAKLERALERAKASGDARKIAAAEDELEKKRALAALFKNAQR
ncbi:DUF349 domain-containing protein [Falsarthrobacter nasiphocae]|uniref:DUF349 domain-containing protein n=1 Tax=Falsarthrobacter nasiphocae TaxID=189863 RepID=A0AAE3YIS7_9MICC|nr:DUF349 domain-containing protein [Falsarthrobacter nasiphocae]MDR6892970.1 hypothetical protein [Falsarthrobacter nasiphocae]